MHGKQRVPAIVALLGILLVAGCSTSSSSGSTSGSLAGSASASTPIASSSAVAKAKQQATVCLQQTGTARLLSSAGRSQFVTCLEHIVSPAERQAFKNCMVSAVVSDQVWTKAGREKFTSMSLGACLNNAAAATPSASLRGRIQPGGPGRTASTRSREPFTDQRPRKPTQLHPRPQTARYQRPRTRPQASTAILAGVPRRAGAKYRG
jgi:hypothetical protein